MNAHRRGRRPAGSGARQGILEAARSQFGELGYEHTTLRSVATQADVDPRLVLHYFGSKHRLFMESVQLPVDPEALLGRVFAPGEGSPGHRAAEALLGVLEEPSTRQMAIALLRSAASEPEAARLIRVVLTERVLLPLTSRVGGDQPQLRASLMASQFVGLAMARYVVAIEPLASAPVEQLVRALGPVYDHYLSGAWLQDEPSDADGQAEAGEAEGQPASGSPA